MNLLRENIRLIAECSQKLVSLGENLWGKEQKFDKAEPLDVPTMTTDFVKEHGLPCPEGHVFKDENGNVINAKKIVLEKKKKEYPKTYEECYKIMGVKLSDCYIQGYKSPLLEDLQELLICRDAYWKIAGEEMGLGEPWEPGDNKVFGIIRQLGKIQKYNDFAGSSTILEFPTEEMRDAFYENFKEEIESVKELL